jgi:uncharacterized protein (DUF427 family)
VQPQSRAGSLGEHRHRRYHQRADAPRSELSAGPVHPARRLRVGAAQRSAHTTYCPYKGDAAYFDIAALGDKGANAVWTYEHPYPAVAEIAGHLAFYPNIVSVTELTDAVSE